MLSLVLVLVLVLVLMLVLVPVPVPVLVSLSIKGSEPPRPYSKMQGEGGRLPRSSQLAPYGMFPRVPGGGVAW